MNQELVLLIATLFFSFSAVVLLLSTAYAQKRFRRKMQAERKKLDTREPGVLLYLDEARTRRKEGSS